jgi:hypothetical protein
MNNNRILSLDFTLFFLKNKLQIVDFGNNLIPVIPTLNFVANTELNISRNLRDIKKERHLVARRCREADVPET